MAMLRNWKLAGLILCLILGLSHALAQNTTGTIVGHVTDSTGANVASAQVTVTNQGTSRARTVTTTTSGDFTAPLLEPGNYKVEVTLPGFANVTTSASSSRSIRRYAPTLSLK